jgi:cysteine desulfurase
VLYFDHNATHPLSAAARAAWLEAVEKYPANPSSPHRLGQRAEAALENARERLAALLGCTVGRIVFTSGATEANNQIIFHHAARGSAGWASGIEHPSLREPLLARFAKPKLVATQPSGEIDLTGLAQALAGDRPAMFALMAANNETGVLQPWQSALAMCRAAGVSYVCDATQWLGRLPARGLGECDFLTASAHKFGGPVGVGFLAGPEKTAGLLLGGPQESGRRAGTENLPGILAMVAALKERETALRAGAADERLAWRQRFERELTAALPAVRILGAEADRLWNTVAVLMPETPDCRRRWVVVLDRLGFAVSTGSACASGKEAPSHVLLAMGIAPAEAGRALRFSAGWATTWADWERLREGLLAAAREMGCSAS